MMNFRGFFAMLCAACFAIPAQAEVKQTLDIRGDVETNATIQWFTNESKEPDALRTSNNGRARFRVQGGRKQENGWFAFGRGDLMIPMSGAVGIDDAFAQIGTPSISLKVGRFQAEESFANGLDVYIAKPRRAPSRYEGQYAQGRFGGGVGNAALRFRFNKTTLLEINGVFGGQQQSGSLLTTEKQANTGRSISRIVGLPFGANAYGIRPFFRFGSERVVVKAAFEYFAILPQQDAITAEAYTGDNDYRFHRMGETLAILGNFERVQMSLSAGYGTEGGNSVNGKALDDRATFSVLGWLSAALFEADVAGIGVGYTTQQTDYQLYPSLRGKADTSDVIETYLAYVHQLPFEGAKMAIGVSYATLAVDPEGRTAYDNRAYGARVRFSYAF